MNPAHSIERVGRPPAGMANELEIGLQRDAGTNLILIDRCKQRLRSPDRPVRSDDGLKVAIESLHVRRDVGIGERNAELVMWPSVGETDELEATIGIIVD